MRKHWAQTLAVVAVVAVVAAACSSGSTTSSGKQLKFIFVSHGASTDPFWLVVLTGFTQAGKDLGISTVYRATPQNLTDPNLERQLMQAAIAEKPDGLIFTDPSPDVLNSTIETAKAAGIPFVLSNAGLGESLTVGALTYVGNDETGSGAEGARLELQEG